MAGIAPGEPDPVEETVFEADMTKGFVERIEDGVAVVLIGEDMEEWDFPSHMLPDEAEPETVLLLRGAGRDVEIIGIDRSAPSVESRLGRDLSRKRPIVFPLPQRADEGELTGPRRRAGDQVELEIDKRVSKLARNLGHAR